MCRFFSKEIYLQSVYYISTQLTNIYDRNYKKRQILDLKEASIDITSE